MDGYAICRIDHVSNPEIPYHSNYDRLEESIFNLTEDLRSTLHENYQLCIPPACDGFLSRCLRVKDYNVEKAAKLVRNVARSTQSLDDMLVKFRPKLYRNLYFSGTITLLSSRDSRGRQVFLSRIGKWDPKEFDFDESTAAQMLLFSCAIADSRESQRNGVVFLYDLTGFGMKHVKAMKPSRLLQLIGMMQDASPGRIKGVHLVFHPRVFGIIYQMVRPFFTEKLARRVYFHGDDLRSLHRWLDVEILPDSLGGIKPESEAVDFAFLRKLLQMDNIHKEMMAYGVPAS